MINVTKPYLPDFDEYVDVLKGIWERNWLTNRGPLVTDLEERLKQHLGLGHLLFVSNGTIAIQVAMKALDMTREIITTPFSYVATTTSILWENCTPVFADIDEQTFCIDPARIEQQITPKTTGILATHVYGFPCDVEQIQRIAKKHNLKVIYDAAHAFGVQYKGKSLLSYGDISTCSFHATKVFHTGEGGAIVSNVPALNDRLFKYHTFGHLGDVYYDKGINAKNSEFHAALGLCNLKNVEAVIAQRKLVFDHYTRALVSTSLRLPSIPVDTVYNYSYYPVVFQSEQELLRVKNALEKEGINTRRYFYPSLNNLPYLENRVKCPVSDSIALRVLCLPMYHDLASADIDRIASTVTNNI